MVEITSERGEKETVELEETLAHSGVFTGSVQLKPAEKPTAGNLSPTSRPSKATSAIRCGCATSTRPPARRRASWSKSCEVPVVVGTDGLVAAFSKTFSDETLAVETQFHIAESYFELFKSHKKLERDGGPQERPGSGPPRAPRSDGRLPDPKYVPRIAYLLGQFAQELEQWNEAIERYQMIVRQYPDHSLAADAQFKLAQCYEEAGDFDQALEAYVTLAATYPKSPLIANVMIRISDHFYQETRTIEVAAQVGEKFLERFDGHEWALADGVPRRPVLLQGQAVRQGRARRSTSSPRCSPTTPWPPTRVLGRRELPHGQQQPARPSGATTAAAGSSPPAKPPSTPAAAWPCPRCCSSSSEADVNDRNQWKRSVMRYRCFMSVCTATRAVCSELPPRRPSPPAERSRRPKPPMPRPTRPHRKAVETTAAAAGRALVSGDAPVRRVGYMIDGGIFMWPILILGILAAGRDHRALPQPEDAQHRQRGPAHAGAQPAERRPRGRGPGAVRRPARPVPAILVGGLAKIPVLKRLNYDPGKIEEQVVKGMDDYGVHIVAALEKHLPILATVSSAAPMLGFLGTVQGMVISFDDIVGTMGEVNIVDGRGRRHQGRAAHDGAGPDRRHSRLHAYNYFTSVINRFVLDVEESATELIEAVTLQMALRQQESQIETRLSCTTSQRPQP